MKQQSAGNNTTPPRFKRTPDGFTGFLRCLANHLPRDAVQVLVLELLAARHKDVVIKVPGAREDAGPQRLQVATLRRVRNA